MTLNKSSASNNTQGNLRTTALFLCLAKNCERSIPSFFSYLKNLQKEDISYLVLIGESGSSDRTRELIKQAYVENVQLVDTSCMLAELPRLSRMAIGRQALRDYVLARNLVAEFICIVDLDNVIERPPEPKALKLSIDRLRSDESIFAIGATSKPVYYDLLSLISDGHDYSRLSGELMRAKSHLLSYYMFHKRNVYRNQLLITTEKEINCESSFNGFCIYRYHDYVVGNYRANNEAEICEHVNFNLSIGRQTGKHMIISPHLIIQAPVDHIPVGMFRFWIDRICKLWA